MEGNLEKLLLLQTADYLLHGMNASREWKQPPVRSLQGIPQQKLHSDIRTFCSSHHCVEKMEKPALV